MAMKNKRWLLITPFAALGVLFVGAVLVFNSGLWQEQIEAKVRDASGAKVTLGPVRLGIYFPLRVNVGPSRIEHPLADVEWAHLRVDLKSFLPPFQLRVHLEEPRIRMKPVPETPAGQPPELSDAGGGAASLPPIGLELLIDRGHVEAPAATVTDLHLDFEQRRVLASMARVHLRTDVSVGALAGARLPVTLDSDAVELSLERVKSDKILAGLAGLTADMAGEADLGRGTHDWRIKIDAPDLSRLPTPPGPLPVKNWRGQMNADVRIARAGAAAPFSAGGQIDARDVRAELALKQDGTHAEGPLTLALKTEFSAIGKVLRVSELNGNLDLSGARLAYKDLFVKAPGVPLKLSANAQGDETRVNLSGLDVTLAHIQAHMSGTLAAQAPFAADLKLKIPEVALGGLEKLLPPLASSPVEGLLALDASLQGPLADPLGATVRVNQLKLAQVAAQVKYEKPGALAARGRVGANMLAQAEIDRGTVKSAKASGAVNLKDTALVAGPLRKEAGQEMAADFALAQAAGELAIERLDVRTFFGRLGARGRVGNPFKPKLALAVTAAPVSLSELRVAMPSLRDLIPKGDVKGNLQINGPLEMTKPWNDWPLAISGDVSATIPEYQTAPSAPAPAGGKAAEKAPATSAPPKGFLPPGYLVSHLKVRVSGDIARVTHDKLKLERASVRGLIADQHFRGEGGVGQVFGGSVQAKGLDVPLVQNNPTLQGTVLWNAITIEDAIGFAKPEYKEMAKGKTAGRAEFATQLPSSPDFMKALRARGEATANPLTLNSVKIGDMINDAIKQVPVLKVAPVKVDPLHGDMKLAFELSQQTVNIPSFLAHDQGGSDLQMKGKVTLTNMQADLVGNLFWQQDQVKGCLAEGNSDPKGRLIVPLAIRGDLMKPGFSLLSDTLQKLAGRALECEKKKLIDRVQKEGVDGLKKQLGDTLKGIFGN